MIYLVDTNIWLERLLDQEQSAEVGHFLEQVFTDQLLISDFTLHSIGVILDRLRQEEVLLQFVNDIFVENKVTLVSVPPEAMSQVVAAIKQFDLDFDDAYQYVAAKRANALIISFDGDFDRVDCKRQTPASVLEEIKITED